MQEYYKNLGLGEEEAGLRIRAVHERELDILSSAASAKQSKQEVKLIGGYSFKANVVANSSEEAWFVFDTLHNPMPEAELAKLAPGSVIERQTRLRVLDHYGFSIVPVAPYPIIEPDFQHLAKRAKDTAIVSVSYAKSPRDEDIYLLRVTEDRGENEYGVREGLVYAKSEQVLHQYFNPPQV